ncbi:MAG: hypothetical protein RLZZ573_92 [Pseudomonadota bacterium]|jgi:threonine/homoserine/homoserine lactone efflux protein
MMPDTWLAASRLLALASSFTPGPNNAMLMASGVNVGFRRSVRHLRLFHTTMALALVASLYPMLAA